jgi:hypothetical protein
MGQCEPSSKGSEEPMEDIGSVLQEELNYLCRTLENVQNVDGRELGRVLGLLQ